MIEFYILMPFSRGHNAEAVKKSFEAACKGMKGLAHLIAICSNPEHIPLIRESILIYPKPVFDPCYWKINMALAQILPLPPNSFVGFICDDDALEEGFFAQLESEIGERNRPRVAVVNMKRWFHGQNPVDELGAGPGNMRVGTVGLEQYFIRGDVMSNWRFNETVHHADGDLMERMYRDIPNDFLFLPACSPHLFVNWNNLPG